MAALHHPLHYSQPPPQPGPMLALDLTTAPRCPPPSSLGAASGPGQQHGDPRSPTGSSVLLPPGSHSAVQPLTCRRQSQLSCLLRSPRDSRSGSAPGSCDARPGPPRFHTFSRLASSAHSRHGGRSSSEGPPIPSYAEAALEHGHSCACPAALLCRPGPLTGGPADDGQEEQRPLGPANKPPPHQLQCPRGPLSPSARILSHRMRKVSPISQSRQSGQCPLGISDLKSHWPLPVTLLTAVRNA